MIGIRDLRSPRGNSCVDAFVVEVGGLPTSPADRSYDRAVSGRTTAGENAGRGNQEDDGTWAAIADRSRATSVLQPRRSGAAEAAAGFSAANV
jgi:hypothetical protein